MQLFSTLQIDTWVVLKAMFVIGMGVYILFALIIVRQVRHMTKTLQVGFESLLLMFAWIHLFAAVLLLLYSIFYL